MIYADLSYERRLMAGLRKEAFLAGTTKLVGKLGVKGVETAGQVAHAAGPAAVLGTAATASGVPAAAADAARMNDKLLAARTGGF